MSDLEHELEQELQRVLDPISRLPIPARRLARHGGVYQRIAGGAGAALAFKVLTGVAVAAAAVTVAGAATTGSINPLDWSQGMSKTVENCTAALTPGHHGIGECVSDIANQHGMAVASAARHHGNGSGGDQSSANSHGKNKDNGNGHGAGHGGGGGSGILPPAPPTGGSGQHRP